jgi:hypothetical protein
LSSFAHLPPWSYPLLFVAGFDAGLVVRKGARFVRPAFLVMAGLTTLRLLWINLARSP